jgi:hypothetical protein
MLDRYGNLIRNQQYQFWGEHLRERLDAFPHGEDRPGWRINGYDYPDSQYQMMRRQAEVNDVVPRPMGYTPFQSMFEPDGRHAYNPAGRQYPQTIFAERQYASSRRAETPLDRVQAYEQVRPDPRFVLPNVQYELHVRGIHGAPRYTAPYGSGQGEYQGQPSYGGMGAQSGAWDGYASARR